MKEEKIIAGNVNLEFERKLTLGERAADRVAEFGGSGSFIIQIQAELMQGLMRPERR